MNSISAILVCVIVMVLLLLASRGRQAWLSYSFISVVGILGLYVFDFIRMPRYAQQSLIDPQNYQALLLLSLGFIVAFGLGELIGNHAGYRSPIRAKDIRFGKYWAKLAITLALIAIIGQAVFVLGSGGISAFYGSAHGSAGEFESAYIYRLFHSGFTAAVILLAYHFKGEKLGYLAKVTLILLLVILLFDLVTQGKRGGLIRYALMLLAPIVALQLFTRRRVILAIVGGMSAFALLVILPEIRAGLALGSTDQLGRLIEDLSDPSPNSHDRTVRIDGKHVVFASVVTKGALQNPDPNYGGRWIFPLVNLVPRQIWPDKPLRYEFATDFYDISTAASHLSIPRGSYPGGIPESFSEWSWGVPIVWFIMGWVLGFVRGHALSRKTPMAITIFFATAVFHVHFILQDTIQAIFSLIFLLGPFFGLLIVFNTLLRGEARSAVVIRRQRGPGARAVSPNRSPTRFARI